MVEREGEAAMQFSVFVNGLPVEIPAPGDHPVLREYVAALLELDEEGATITHGAGMLPVGRIRLRTTFAPPPAIDDVGQEAGFRTGVHHCCLLRAPELVVEYRQGPALPDDRIWYAGVFKVFPELDETFAHAEPPTHDGWSPEYLASRDKSIVRTTLRKIDEMLRSHAAPRPSETAGGGGEGLAGMSRLLGSLLAPAPGQGAGPGVGGGGGGRSRASAVRMIGSPTWGQIDGRDVLMQPFEVNAGRPVTIDAEASVRVWGGGGNETDPPEGAGAPQLVGWRAPDGQLHAPGRLAIGTGENGRWEAIVSSPPDTMTRIRVHEATAEGGSG
jgi:hypothetical protein